MEHSPDRINRVWDRLKSAKTREEQIGLLVHNYERSADQPRDIARRMGFADRYARLGLDKANTAVASMPARPVTPTPSGYDNIRARLKAVEAAGIKAGQEEWESTSGSIRGEQGDKKQFSPWDKHPWGSLDGQSYGRTHDIMGRPMEHDVNFRPRREPGSLLRASNQMQANASATHKVQGEASLRIKLASGLAPDGGVKNKGSLFKEIRLDRAPLALASTTG
jgi:hypothetical protein